MSMKKILVIGSGGSGKSTFARRLGARLSLEVIHLDAHHWRAGWVAPPKDEWRRQVEELTRRESWVMDGNFSGTLDVRMAACDTVVFLDLPRAVCLWRVVKRRLKYRCQSRPDMAAGCQEKLDMEFIRWVWSYGTRSRPKIVEMLRQNGRAKRVVWLRSTADVEEFLRRPEGACVD
jgi:adenylate kinase family enzyme